MIARDMNHQCTRCKKVQKVKKIKTYSYKKSGNIDVFVGDNDRKIYGGICYECASYTSRKRLGHSLRIESKKPQVVAAVAAENKAAQYFRSLGFNVKQTEFYGPDLICTLGVITLTVEVKRAAYQSRRWRIACVKPKRINDDLIAIVLQNDKIHIELMKDHLLKCSKCGGRAVTSLIR